MFKCLNVIWFYSVNVKGNWDCLEEKNSQPGVKIPKYLGSQPGDKIPKIFRLS